MQRRYSLAHFILAGVIVLGLVPPMVCVDAQAQIAFVSARDGNRQIYVMDADGKNQRRLTNNVWEDWFPSWSPDGERIVFNSRRDGNFRNDFGITDEIYVMDADGSNQQRLTENLFDDRDPSWSPDGERIVFSSRGHGPDEIYVMDADGSNQRRLTENLFDDRDPSWSPDGEWIAFVSDRDGLFNDEIYVMDADGSNQRRLTNNCHDDIAPAWFDPAFVPAFAVSPAGKKFTMWGWFKRVDR